MEGTRGGAAAHRRARRWLGPLLLAALVALPACQSESVRQARELTAEGDALVADERLSEAHLAYRKALIAAPDHLPARIGLGRVEALAGNFDAALREFQAVLAKDPRSAPAYAGRGEALFRAGRMQEAEAQLRKAAELDPDSLEIAASHAMALVALQKDADGLALFDRAAAGGFELSGSAHLFWGAALERAGRQQEALAKYELALAEEPMDPTIQNNLGLLLVKLGADPERGIALLQRAFAQRPQDANTVFNLGWSHLQVGRIEAATDHLRRALALTAEGTPQHGVRLEQLRLAESRLERGTAAPNAPNVVLVVFDSLRADHVGAYGYRRRVTPNLDRLASRGVVFEQAIAQAPWTAASLASLLTGLEPTAHGLDGEEPLVAGAEPRKLVQKSLPGNLETLAERLRASGYRTAGFASNAFFHSAFGFAQGFDEFVDAALPAPGQAFSGRIAGETNRLVYEWLERAPPEPFFLLVHYTDPHWPYQPPAPYGAEFVADYRGSLRPETSAQAVVKLGKRIEGLSDDDVAYLVGLYDGEIQYADAQLGELLTRLGHASLERPLLTVVTADHGAEFLEHGSGSHGYSLYEEQIRVPLIVAMDGLRPRRVPAQVRLIDVFPTLAELVGLTLAPDTLQGASLVGLARGSRQEGPEAALSEVPFSGPWKSLRTAEGRKLIHHLGDGRSRLFDLRSDPGEQRDLAEEESSAALRKELEGELARRVSESRELGLALREQAASVGPLHAASPASPPDSPAGEPR